MPFVKYYFQPLLTLNKSKCNTHYKTYNFQNYSKYAKLENHHPNQFYYEPLNSRTEGLFQKVDPLPVFKFYGNSTTILRF